MAGAGISDVLVILRPEKDDIPRVLGDGREWGVTLEYVHTGATRGPAETVDRAYLRLRGARVALAFPDILMEAVDPYRDLLEAMDPVGVHGALGVFPPSPHQPADPVRRSEEGRVVEILPKVRAGEEAWCWGMATWSADITEHLHERVSRGWAETPSAEDWSIGRLLNDALGEGLSLRALPVSDVPFLDIGTPRGLRWALEGRRSAPGGTPDGGSAGPDEESD